MRNIGKDCSRWWSSGLLKRYLIQRLYLYWRARWLVGHIQIHLLEHQRTYPLLQQIQVQVSFSSLTLCVMACKSYRIASSAITDWFPKYKIVIGLEILHWVSNIYREMTLFNKKGFLKCLLLSLSFQHGGNICYVICCKFVHKTMKAILVFFFSRSYIL